MLKLEPGDEVITSVNFRGVVLVITKMGVVYVIEYNGSECIFSFHRL